MQPLNFDLTTQEIPVIVGGVKYVLQEASETAAIAYRNARLKAFKMNEAGQMTGLSGGAEIQSILVSHCLFEAQENGSIKLSHNKKPIPVPLSVVSGWPSRIVKVLFDKAKEMSFLEEEETEKSLADQIEILKRRLLKLKEGNRQLKNSQDSTTNNFSNVES